MLLVNATVDVDPGARTIVAQFKVGGLTSILIPPNWYVALRPRGDQSTATMLASPWYLPFGEIADRQC